MPENKGLRPSLPRLTGLRFLAAIAVVISHFMETGIVERSSRLLNILDGGRPAVSLFFVLSGFVLTINYPTLRTSREIGAFLTARFARIYPMVLLSLAISAVGVAYALQHTSRIFEWYYLRTHIALKLIASLIAQIFMLTGWTPAAAINQPWNGPAWSISCEVFFYILFPFLLGRLSKASNTRLIILCSSCWVLQGIWILSIRALVPTNHSGFLVSQFPLTHLFEFILGISTAIWFSRGGKLILKKRTERTVALGCICLAIFALSWLQPIDPAFYLLSPLFAALIAILGMKPLWKQSILASKGAILLGESSFALYMIHIPLIHLYEVARLTGPYGWLAMSGTVIASILIFWWYETPMRQWIRTLQRGSSRSRV